MADIKNNFCAEILVSFPKENAENVDFPSEMKLMPPFLVINHSNKIILVNVNDQTSRIIEDLRCSIKLIDSQYIWCVRTDDGNIILIETATCKIINIRVENHKGSFNKISVHGDKIFFTSNFKCFYVQYKSVYDNIKGDMLALEIIEASSKEIWQSNHQVIGTTSLELVRVNEMLLTVMCKKSNICKDIKLKNPIKAYTTFRDNTKILFQESIPNNQLVLKDFTCPDDDIVMITVKEDLQLIGGFGDTFLYATSDAGIIKVFKVERKNPESLMEVMALNGQFSEATKFAHQNNLDVGSVYKLKFKQMVTNVIDNQENVPCDCFLELLDLMKDSEFLIDLCVILCKKCETYWPLLEKLKTLSSKNNLNMILDEWLFKLNLVKYLEKINLLIELEIYEKSLAELCKYFLAREHIELASWIWLKNAQISQSVNEEEAISILYTTPAHCNINKLNFWLQNYFPPVLKFLPFFIDSAVKWVSERTAQFEKSKYWPEDGITFIRNTLQILENVSQPILVSFACLEQLKKLTLNLKQIKELKQKFKVNIKLAELSLSNPADLVTLVLHRAYTEDIVSVVEEWVSPFTAKTNLQREEIIVDYLEREVMQGTIEDTRIVALLKCMNDLEIRHSVLVTILPTLSVPWHHAILKEALFAVDCNHKYSRCIQVQIEYSKLIMLSIKFNFPPESYLSHSSLLKVLQSSNVNQCDIQTLIELNPKKCSFITLLYIQNCLLAKEISKALNFFESLKINQKSILAKQLTIHLESFLEDTNESLILEETYLDFLRVTKSIHPTRLKYIENMFQIKRCYNINVQLENNDKLKIFEDWCSKNCKLNIYDYYHKAVSLGKLLDIKVPNAVIIKHINGLNIINLIDLITQKKVPVNCFLTECLLDQFKDGRNHELLQKCLQCCVDRLVLCENAEELSNVLETLCIFKDLKDCNSNFVKMSNALKFNNIYIPKMNLTSVNLMLDSLSNDIATLTIKAKEATEKIDIVALKLLVKLSRISSKESEDSECCKNMIENMAIKFLQNILLSPYCDHLMITILLCLVRKPDVWLKDFISIHVKEDSHSNMAIVKFMCNNIFHCKEISLSPMTSFTTKYGLKINNIILPECLYDTTESYNTLANILRANDIKYDCLKEMCNLLKIPIDEALILKLLLTLSLYGENASEFNCNNLYVKCYTICENLEEKTNMVESLKKIWVMREFVFNDVTITLNPYCYEVYMCINKLLSIYADTSVWVLGDNAEISQIRLSLILNFLMYYERKSQPKRLEVQDFLTAGVAPEMSLCRLPFHIFFSENLWAELKGEITMDTYELWLPIAGLLGLDSDVQTAKDMLCSNAVKQSMTLERSINDSLQSKWNLHQTNQILLRKAHKAVTYISNMEWAAACLFYVLQGCRKGADQLAAAQLCYEFACCWSKVQPGNNAVKKMKAEYALMTTLHGLNILGLSDKKYLRKVSDPSSLIKDLYMDEYKSLSLMQTTATRVIDEIAESNCVNVSSVRMQILDGILSRKSEDRIDLDIDDISRLVCVLKSTCPTTGVIYLTRLVGEEFDYYKCKKFKAMQCLISIADNELLFKSIGMNLSQVWREAIEMYFVLMLENNDLSYVVPVFSENKEQVLNVIWQSCEQTKPILTIIVRICLVYDVKVPMINEIISTLISLGMLDELALLLTQKYNFICDNEAVEAWKAIIFAEFNKLEHPIAENRYKRCIKVLNMLSLYSCRAKIDLVGLWNKCLEMKCFELCCLLLPLLNTPQLNMLELSKMEVGKNLKNFASETFLSNLSLKLLSTFNRIRA